MTDPDTFCGWARAGLEAGTGWGAVMTELPVLSLKPYSAEPQRGALYRNYAKEVFVKHVSPIDFARLSKLHMEISDHIVVLTAIVGAMVTTASVDYERLEDCVNFAAKRYRPALLQRASSVLHDLEATQKVIGVENRKRRNSRKRSAGALARQKS